MDSCFLCGLLFPDRHSDDCPRCHRKMRYVPAEHIDVDALEEETLEAISVYQAAVTGEQLDALISLLELLHRLAPHAVEVVEPSTQLSLDGLRRDWERLS